VRTLTGGPGGLLYRSKATAGRGDLAGQMTTQDGSCTYTGRRMQDTHAGMKTTVGRLVVPPRRHISIHGTELAAG